MYVLVCYLNRLEQILELNHLERKVALEPVGNAYFANCKKCFAVRVHGES